MPSLPLSLCLDSGSGSRSVKEGKREAASRLKERPQSSGLENAFSVSLASLRVCPRPPPPPPPPTPWRRFSGPHTSGGGERASSLCRCFGGMNEPGTRIRARSMNHSACTVDVDAEREHDTQTHERSERERERRAPERDRMPSRDQRCSGRRREREGEGGGGRRGQPLVGGSGTRGGGVGCTLSGVCTVAAHRLQVWSM